MEQHDNSQAPAAQHIAPPSTLDMSSAGDVIDWLDRLVVTNGGNTRILELAVSALEHHGYVGGANTGTYYDGENADNSARWLIGLFINAVKNGETDNLTAHFGGFAKEWRDKNVTP